MPLYTISTSTSTRTRGLHLLHHMFTEDNIGRAAMVRKKLLPDASKVSLNLLSADGSESVPMTLAKVLPLIAPFHHLAQIDSQARTYKIIPLTPALQNLPPFVDESKRRKDERPFFKRAGRSREFHLTTSTPSRYLNHVLRKSYEFLLQGVRMEFALHQKSTAKNANKNAIKTIESALLDCPHLRPDTINRSMPEGTT